MAARTNRLNVKACRRQERLLTKDDRRRNRYEDEAEDRFFIAKLHRGTEAENITPYYSYTFDELRTIARTLDDGDVSTWWEVEWYMTDFPMSERIGYLKLNHMGNITDVYTTSSCMKLSFWERKKLLIKEARPSRRNYEGAKG